LPKPGRTGGIVAGSGLAWLFLLVGGWGFVNLRWFQPLGKYILLWADMKKCAGWWRRASAGKC